MIVRSVHFYYPKAGYLCIHNDHSAIISEIFSNRFLTVNIYKRVLNSKSKRKGGFDR